MRSIKTALRISLPVKINCVPMQPYSIADWISLAALAKNHPLDVRFIEMMPIGLGRKFITVKNEFVLGQLSAVYGEPLPSVCRHGNGPARYFDFQGFKGSIGLISAVTNEFCGECNRVRLTSDGKLTLCLCNQENLDLKEMLRSGLNQADLAEKMASAIFRKPHRHNLGNRDDTVAEKNMAQIGG
jgi:cyclic pyranopterin phosphate synthase